MNNWNSSTPSSIAMTPPATPRRTLRHNRAALPANRRPPAEDDTMKFKLTLSRTLLAAALIGAPVFGAATIARAQSTDAASKLLAPDSKNQKEKDRLRARSEERYPEIRRLKSDGKIGESSTGYLEA